MSKIVIPIGDTKVLVYEPDQENPNAIQFAKECKEVAKLKPTSLQDFFIKLNEYQKNNHSIGDGKSNTQIKR